MQSEPLAANKQDKLPKDNVERSQAFRKNVKNYRPFFRKWQIWSSLFWAKDFLNLLLV